MKKTIYYVILAEENQKVMGGQPVLKGTRLPLSRLAYRGFRGFIKDYKTTKKTGDWWKTSLYKLEHPI